ncbi:unnamed protein product [Owenia fusiformis]|uniref:Uncharacterized protein n=1 Tax=Owenia fusiformis TaxID=6347 RepID=A0A8J1XRP7_OWEFU|nr:unnamed protein product [Owenia fusiformis]
MGDKNANVVYMPVLARNPVYPPWATSNGDYGEYYRGGHGHSLYLRWFHPQPDKYNEEYGGEVKHPTHTQKMIDKHMKRMALTLNKPINTNTANDLDYIRSKSVPAGGNPMMSYGDKPGTPQPGEWSLPGPRKAPWVANPHVKPRPTSPRIRNHYCFDRKAAKKNGFVPKETGIHQPSQCLNTQQIINSGNGAWVLPNIARELGVAADPNGRLHMLTDPQEAIQRRVDEHTYRRRHGPDIAPGELGYLMNCAKVNGPVRSQKLVKRRTTNGTYGGFIDEYEDIDALPKPVADFF